jgi:hypothetical protein
VANYLEISSGSLHWNVRFTRAVHDWKVDVFTLVFNFLYSFRLGWGGENKLWWPPSKRGAFDVRSLYNILVLLDCSHFSWKCIWWSKVPLKATFFAWSVALEKIFTLDNFRKRHVLVVDWCYMCKRSDESVDHLLLHCEVASALWTVIFSHHGLSWVTLNQVIDLFACWRGLYDSSKSATVWKMMLSCLLWCLWRKMIERSFEDRKRTVVELSLSSLILFTSRQLL